MKCPNCGAENGEKAQFCQLCFTKLASSKNSAAVDVGVDPEENMEEKGELTITGPIPSEDKFKPLGFDEFIGQEHVKKIVLRELEICHKYQKPFPHTLVMGHAGLGKSTLVSLIAKNLDTKVYSFTAPIKEKVWQTVMIDTGYEYMNGFTTPQIIYLDEIHLQEGKQEFMYTCLQDGIMYYEGCPYTTPPFTLMGATTDEGELSEPFLQRFELQLILRPYSIDDLTKIVNQSLKKIQNIYQHEAIIREEAEEMLVKLSWGTPRLLNHYLGHAFKIILLQDSNEITMEVFEEVIRQFQLTSEGLTRKDLAYLDVLNRVFKRKPRGAASVAAVLRENPKTLTKYIEPKLLQLELIVATPRGRQITEKGIEYLERWSELSE